MYDFINKQADILALLLFVVTLAVAVFVMWALMNEEFGGTETIQCDDCQNFQGGFCFQHDSHLDQGAY